MTGGHASPGPTPRIVQRARDIIVTARLGPSSDGEDGDFSAELGNETVSAQNVNVR